MAKTEGKVYVVTGGNRGIGLAIVKALCKAKGEDDVVYLCARNKERGEAAVAFLESEGLKASLAIIDLEDLSTAEIFAAMIKEKHGGVDAVMNNAGIAYHADSEVPLKEQIERTINTNFFGTLGVCKQLFPLLRKHARVVNMGSQAGHMVYTKLIPELLEQLNSSDLKMSDLSFIMKAYLASMAAAGDGGEADEAASKWPASPYALSKLAVHYMSLLQQKLFAIDPDKDVIINCVCPGFCDTDFTKGKGPRSAEEGAVTPVYALTLPPSNAKNPKGQFLYDKQPLELGTKILPIFKQKPSFEKLDEHAKEMEMKEKAQKEEQEQEKESGEAAEETPMEA